MILNDLIMLLSESARSRAYVDLMLQNQLIPSHVIVVESAEMISSPVVPVETDLFNNTSSVIEKLKKVSIPFEIVKSDSFNSTQVVSSLRKYTESKVVFSGPAGTILSADFFAIGKQYIHIHPGRLPEYRGSTPMYYSLLLEDTIWMTAFLMNPNIDDGKLLIEKQLRPPTDRLTIDLSWDPYARATILIDVLSHYANHGELPVSEKVDKESENYYVIHPVLKHIAILSDTPT
jgi:methionyl-tRNA formyltransferase